MYIFNFFLLLSTRLSTLKKETHWIKIALINIAWTWFLVVHSNIFFIFYLSSSSDTVCCSKMYKIHLHTILWNFDENKFNCMRIVSKNVGMKILNNLLACKAGKKLIFCCIPHGHMKLSFWFIWFWDVIFHNIIICFYNPKDKKFLCKNEVKYYVLEHLHN